MEPVNDAEKTGNEMDTLRSSVQALSSEEYALADSSHIWACYRRVKDMLDGYGHKPEDTRLLTVALMCLEDGAKYNGKERQTSIEASLLALERIITTSGWEKK